jgi:hypothetical protein
MGRRFSNSVVRGVGLGAMVAATLAATVAAMPAALSAQTPPPSTAAARTGGAVAQPADSLIVSLLTMGQGAMVFDRFGHSAIRIQNLRTGLDSAWNWGMFDFSSPALIPRFVAGRTQYWMAGYPSLFFVDYYRREGRAVWEQELELRPAAADSLLRLLRWNALEQNKFYRYDYYLDNCSTRVRDALDAVMGGALRTALDGPGAGVTWRGETLRLGAEFPLISFGMTFTLGARADEQVTRWQEGFIPMHLRDALRNVRVAGPNGEVPLVRAERQLAPETSYVEAKEVPDLSRAAGVIGLVAGWVIVLLGRGAGRRALAGRAVALLGSAWHLGAGFAGLLVLLAGVLDRHHYMGANTNVLLGTPISLILVWVYWRSWSASASARTRRTARNLSLFTAGAALLAAATHAVPGLAPVDLSPIYFALPIHLAFAMALVRRDRVPDASPVAA